MTYDLEHLGRQVDKLSDAIEENTSEKGENSMNDIAGLLALMQGNKGMDLPGLLALCKEKGYDRIADAAVHRLENFAIQHYKVTNVPSGASA